MTKTVKKWFYKPQEEINTELKKYDSHRLVSQCVTKEFLYEKFIVQNENEMFVLLFEVRKTEYGTGYNLQIFKPV